MKRSSLAYAAGLATVVATAAVLLVSLGARQFVGYDSFWHVFIASQERWTDLWREVGLNAHPPLYFVALRGAISAFGRNPLAYRFISIVADLASIVLFAGVVARLTSNRALAVMAAAAFGLSFAIADNGLEVRSYALSLAFLLAALRAYLEWLESNPARLARWVRPTFACAMTAALVTHYSSFFFLSAALGAPVVLALVHRRWTVRLALEVRGHAVAVGVMFGVPLAASALLYWFHVRRWSRGLNHVAGFMYDRAHESALAFVARTTKTLTLLFLPDVGTGAAMLALAALLAVVAVLVASRPDTRARLGGVPLVLTAIMLLLNLYAALVGRYPYGGELRHEVFLFPFALIVVFVTIEGVRRLVPARYGRTSVWATVAAIAIAASSAAWLSGVRIRPPLAKAQMDEFHAELGAPAAVLVDQFNFILFYGLHHEWRWHLAWEDPAQEMWQLWEVTRGGDRFEVCRSGEWLFDFSQPRLYADIAHCLARGRVGQVAVFRSQQGGLAAGWPTHEAAGFALKLGRLAGVVPEKVSVRGDDVYASFAALEAQPPNRRIRVGEATYGGSCGAVSGNATAQLRTACEGVLSCLYRVQASVLGDPAAGCAKDFRAAWTCDDDADLRRLTVPAEAGFGAAALLTCMP